MNTTNKTARTTVVDLGSMVGTVLPGDGSAQFKVERLPNQESYTGWTPGGWQSPGGVVSPTAEEAAAHYLGLSPDDIAVRAHHRECYCGSCDSAL